MCKHHSTFGNYKNITQFLNRGKVNHLALYVARYYIKYFITIVLTCFNFTQDVNKIHTMDDQKYSHEYFIFQHSILIHIILLLENLFNLYLCNKIMQCKTIIVNSSRHKIILSINGH
jgi:hypothetical protein